MVAMADVMLSPGVQKLQRYENSFRRVFDNSWKKLKELQKARQASAEQNKPKSVSAAAVPASSARPDCPPEAASHTAPAQDSSPTTHISSAAR